MLIIKANLGIKKEFFEEVTPSFIALNGKIIFLNRFLIARVQTQLITF
jgi:hypothetical protein